MRKLTAALTIALCLVGTFWAYWRFDEPNRTWKQEGAAHEMYRIGNGKNQCSLFIWSDSIEFVTVVQDTTTIRYRVVYEKLPDYAVPQQIGRLLIGGDSSALAHSTEENFKGYDHLDERCLNKTRYMSPALSTRIIRFRRLF